MGPAAESCRSCSETGGGRRWTVALKDEERRRGGRPTEACSAKIVAPCPRQCSRMGRDRAASRPLRQRDVDVVLPPKWIRHGVCVGVALEQTVRLGQAPERRQLGMRHTHTSMWFRSNTEE